MLRSVLSSWIAPPEVWHEGELAMQTRAGTRGDMQGHDPYLPMVPPEFASFIESLSFLVLGSLNPGQSTLGLPYASIIAGPAGFATCVDANTLLLRTSLAQGDPLGEYIAPGVKLAVVAIRMQTRKRIRASGVVQKVEPGLIQVGIEFTWGNCPQYINQREAEFVPSALKPAPLPISSGDSSIAAKYETVLDDASVALLRKADAFFIASYHHVKGPDVSHRGGPPGFIRVEENRQRIAFPDYKGNGYFQTLGNVVSSQTAGIVVPNFETGDALYLAGHTTILQDEDEVRAINGALRVVKILIQHCRLVKSAIPLKWTEVRLSRQNVNLA